MPRVGSKSRCRVGIGYTGGRTRVCRDWISCLCPTQSHPEILDRCILVCQGYGHLIDCRVVAAEPTYDGERWNGKSCLIYFYILTCTIIEQPGHALSPTFPASRYGHTRHRPLRHQVSRPRGADHSSASPVIVSLACDALRRTRTMASSPSAQESISAPSVKAMAG